MEGEVRGMATIKEIAKACKVSVATVSNILNEKPGASEATRELVLRTAEKMEYTPNYVAKNLKMKNTRSIGVIVEDMTIFSVPDIVDGITEDVYKRQPLVLFSLAAVGMAANEVGGAGGPLAVLVVTIFAAECGKLVSKETKIDIIVTPFTAIKMCIRDRKEGETRCQKSH